MSWGKSSDHPPPRSALSRAVPLIILLIVLLAFSFVAYHLYIICQKVTKTTSDKMQSKNLVFTKDGLKVSVKELKNENYVDTTQSFVVKAWNLSTWPGYKSRLWNKPPVEARKPHSRHASNAN